LKKIERQGCYQSTDLRLNDEIKINAMLLQDSAHQKKGNIIAFIVVLILIAVMFGLLMFM